MAYDTEKVDEMTLALMWLVRWHDSFGPRAWKGFDWDTLDRLCDKGFISDPKSKAKSVALTPAGHERAKELFAKHFGVAE